MFFDLYGMEDFERRSRSILLFKINKFLMMITIFFRTQLRLPYGLSPSPTRKTFQTRRSMSPIAMRPSSLGPVKRKFDLDDYTQSYSPPPFKKAFTER